jgi:hypothetical protein
MSMNAEPRLQVRLYRTAAAGNEPVREWLKALPPEERKIIGDDLKNCTVRLATWNAPDPQVGTRVVGGALSLG